jgi:hypothetical protein
MKMFCPSEQLLAVGAGQITSSMKQIVPSLKKICPSEQLRALPPERICPSDGHILSN